MLVFSGWLWPPTTELAKTQESTQWLDGSISFKRPLFPLILGRQ